MTAEAKASPDARYAMVPDTTQIARPTPHLRRESLDLVLGDLPNGEREAQVESLLAAAGQNEATLQGLFCSLAGECLVGAVFTEVQPGRTAAVWLPRVTPDAPSGTAGALMAAACEWLENQDVAMAQTLLATVPEPDQNVLASARFVHLAELLYLVASKDQFPNRQLGGTLQFVPAGAADHEQLAAIVEATYAGTCDCAGLDGVRQIQDVLSGYRAVGTSGADEWFFVRCGCDDVGCLILADHPRQGSLELVYMGVVPMWRGRGWGTEVAQWAEWRARVLGRDRLVLAVDAENGPALAVYVAAGFRAWDRRSVYIRTFGS